MNFLLHPKESKKELIKKKSYELFLAGNFQFASVNEIVRACEVAKGTYYNYYQSKDEVYLEAAKNLPDRLMGGTASE